MPKKKLDLARPVEVAPKIYWTGFDDVKAGLRCNPYLMLDGKDTVFFDPGSVPHFPQVLNKVGMLTDLAKINYIIVHHQDPDLCAAIPKFEEIVYGSGGSLKIVTHSRAALLITHYGIRSEYYLVDQNGWQLKLQSGRVLKFVFTPFLHFPGAFTTYDKKTKTLFSSDIFGGFSFDWDLYANEFYIEAMKAFHENYMPSNEILRVAMTKFEKLDIRLIAPQHGSLIRKDVKKYIQTLKELECGDFSL